MKTEFLCAATMVILCAQWPIASAQDFEEVQAAPINLVGYDYYSCDDRDSESQDFDEVQAAPINLVGYDHSSCDDCDSNCRDACCNPCDDCCCNDHRLCGIHYLLQHCCSNPCDDCCCGPSLYASVNLRGSFDHLQSGGFNTVGPHPNTGSDNSDTFSIGGAIGTRIPRNLGTLRLECEGIYVDPFNTVTNSFPGPPGPITFFYRTQYSNRWAVLANCWFDIPINNCLDLYAGGGIGGGGATMSVDDFVVQGRGSSSDVVWQVGCGLVRRFNRVAVDLGYRYMDWGKSEVTITGGGNFTADVTSHQVFLGIRYNRLGDLFSYR